MSILSDTAILESMKRGEIVIDPFDPEALGGNSYDVHLSSHLMTYTGIEAPPYIELDVKREETRFCEYAIDLDDGFTLRPGHLYLASTIEYTETHRHVAYLDGKSSIGRLGISIHATAGRGDVGFCNHWTMEITVVHPVRVYAGMPIGQLTYHTVEGEVSAVYASKASAKYTTRDPKPQPSAMWKNFRRGGER